jgi:hypothetical protein
VDEEDRDRLIAKVSADVDWLLASARHERDVRRAARRDVSWFDQVIAEVEPLADEVHDLEVFRAIRPVVERHGPGPYPADELALLAQQGLDAVHRVLASMTAAGLATPPPGEQPNG